MEKLTTIGRGAFVGTPLTQLGNMDSLTTIGDSAFQGCEHLNSVHLPNTLKNVGIYAFEDCPLGDLTVRSGANFECRCVDLANRIKKSRDARVELEGPRSTPFPRVWEKNANRVFK